MQITQLIEALRQSGPINFIWGAGCSGLEVPGPWRTGRQAEDAAAIDDAHASLLALCDYKRKQILKCRTNWAGICMAELLRIGRAARVLTTNFDDRLVRATATFRMMPPLYRRDYPELRDAATPCIYLLGGAPPEILAGLVGRGAATGPWIAIGCSGKRFGLSRTLLSVSRYDHGLYWIGHFHEEPPAELRDGLFTPERNAHWITGFDADSFMAYLLRGLGEFPPPQLVPKGKKMKPETCLAAFESQRPEGTNLRPIMPAVKRLQTAGSAEVQTFLEKLAGEDELALRAGHSALGLGIVANLLAGHRSPRLLKPFLTRAADLMEPDAPGDVLARFSEVCCKLARYSYGERAGWWYARADAAFAQMDSGPGCDGMELYSRVSRWGKMLVDWACFEPHAQSEAVFERVRTMFMGAIAKCVESAASPVRAGEARHARKAIIAEFIPAFHQRVRTLPAGQALELLAEARTWLEELRTDEDPYIELLARHLFCEAEMAPDRQVELLGQAEEQFRTMLRLLPGQAGAILSNWAAALSQLAQARSGEEAPALCTQADRKFQEAANVASDAVLHNNWSSLLIHEARQRGGRPELWKQARGHAGRADALEAGKGSYHLACIAGERADREGVALWLERSAEHGKIPRLSHILSDRSFEKLRGAQWIRELLDGIFDAGLAREAK
ncbi:MAG TPA: hypothetical protein VKF41_04935 [Bryobacteraceae bacterium]|nr:hypothetical protein [Bryobacteraceae bacterium]